MTDSPWQYFSLAELSCECCGTMMMDSSFMVKVVAMRRECGFPFKVTSGYRCPEHNAEVSTTGLLGPHTTGRALDVAIARTQAYFFTKSAFDHGMSGIGFSQKGDDRFIHIDDLTTVPRQNIWSY